MKEKRGPVHRSEPATLNVPAIVMEPASVRENGSRGNEAVAASETAPMGSDASKIDATSRFSF